MHGTCIISYIFVEFVVVARLIISIWQAESGLIFIREFERSRIETQ